MHTYTTANTQSQWPLKRNCATSETGNFGDISLQSAVNYFILKHSAGVSNVPSQQQISWLYTVAITSTPNAWTTLHIAVDSELQSGCAGVMSRVQQQWRHINESISETINIGSFQWVWWNSSKISFSTMTFCNITPCSLLYMCQRFGVVLSPSSG